MQKTIYVLEISKSDHRDHDVQVETYSFLGANGPIRWPKGEAANLGPVGAWNFFTRLGHRPRWISLSGVKQHHVRGQVLVIVDSRPLREGFYLEIIKEWLGFGGIVIASGEAKSWTGSIFQSKAERYDHPYAALAYLPPRGSPHLVAPPGFSFALPEPIQNPGWRWWGCLMAIHGERQTPHRALTTDLQAPAIAVRDDNFFFLNANPFEAFQGWLQGQYDLGPWMNWYHRLFWLDEYAAFLYKALIEVGALSSRDTRPGVESLGKKVVVLRHDLDSSKDVSYLEEEVEREITAVHAVLDDANTRFWISRLSLHPEQEIALHYNTIQHHHLAFWKSRLGIVRSPMQYRPNHRAIRGRGLLGQVRQAIRKGIQVETLHRHGLFLIYPEWIDAMNAVFEEVPECLGDSSLFRGSVLRWGAKQVDGAIGTVGDFPDSLFPLWFPFRLAHGGYGGRPLRGWQSTCVMEIEPELFHQMLCHEISNIEQSVFVINLHPAHANGATFRRGGCLPWFREILDIARDNACQFMTLRGVYRVMNQCVNER